MVKAVAALVVAVLTAPALFAQQRPGVAVSGDRLMLTLPASILARKEVRRQLDSALTTTFIVKTRIRGTKEEAAARLEIRYDLWDEVFHVKRHEPPARVSQQRITGAALLEQWWRTPVSLPLARQGPSTIDIELIVLPFSVAEESDAREWLSKSGGRVGPESQSSGIVDVLIGTTITAKPILTFRWSAEVVRR